MKKFYCLVVVFILFAGATYAQSQYQPYSYDFYQKFNKDLYSIKTRAHTSYRPFFADDSLLKKRYDSLMAYGSDTAHHSWVHRKLFTEHLIQVKDPDYTFYADYLTDVGGGRDFSNNKTTSINTRGYQLGGTIGSKFSFYTTGFENQGIFAPYMTTYINQVGIVPGQAYDRSEGKNTKDWSYGTALLSYTPIKYLNVTMGYDKNFIGDGYRSMLLSDYSSPYPFLKGTLNLGNVQYTVIWAQMTDPTAPKFSYQNGDRKKWATFHYLDWNISNRVSFGFFDAVVWADKDNNGVGRGFDFSYANPIIFLRPVEASVGSPDNAMIGFTGKYKIADGVALYGQFALDEFSASTFFSNDGSYRNKYGYQIGIRGADLFKVRSLNYLLEYNGAKPYTYSEQLELSNYAQQNEPLAHPFGANFREVVGLLSYSYKRFNFSGEGDFGRYGLDINGINYGKDPFQSYTAPARPGGLGNYIGQGLTTNMYYFETKISYLINPKTNLRIELGGIYRDETNVVFHDKTSMITIGLRSSFRNLYNDIASYKVH
jgi:hypothetical protein